MVEDEHATRLEMVVEAPKGFPVMIAVATDAERATHVDRPVAARKVELVRCLRVQVRREPLALGPLPTQGEHVRREVGPVDIKPVAEERDQHPAGPARHVERRLPRLDVRAEELDLGTVEVELGPPPRDESVVPGLGFGRRLGGHGRAIVAAIERQAISVQETVSRMLPRLRP